MNYGDFVFVVYGWFCVFSFPSILFFKGYNYKGNCWNNCMVRLFVEATSFVLLTNDLVSKLVIIQAGCYPCLF